jgi:hypothetical protein
MIADLTIIHAIQIFVETPSTKTIIFELDPDITTVKELKKMIKDREGVDVDAQRLIYSGKQMEDVFVLSQYKIQNHSTIKLVLRLLG